MLRNNLIPLYLYTGHPLPRPERLYDYVLTAQGIVKRVETPYVSADHLLAPIETNLIGLRLATYRLQPLRFKLPRIPGRLLQEVLADARRNLALEYMYQVKFDPVTGRWTVTRPDQDQSRSRVGYTALDPSGVVLDLHSHHTMPAFFSATDDSDEKGGRFYGVMGHLERAQPELAVRLGLYGHWIPNVPALILFDHIDPFIEVYPDPSQPPALVENLSTTGSWLTNLFNRRST